LSCHCPSFAPRLSVVCASFAPRQPLLSVCGTVCCILTTPYFHYFFRPLSHACDPGFPGTIPATVPTLYICFISLCHCRCRYEICVRNNNDKKHRIAATFELHDPYFLTLPVTFVLIFPTTFSSRVPTQPQPVCYESRANAAQKSAAEVKFNYTILKGGLP
jgi:hypothetical protein